MFEEDEPPPTGGDPPADPVWGEAGQGDPFAHDAFSQEIANIAPADWELDADLLWGDAGGQASAGDQPEADFFG